MTKEPKAATMLSARLARAYPSLSAYSAATLAEELCAIERAQRRHAERCCSGVDGGYVKTIFRVADDGSFVTSQIHDPDAEERAGKRIDWRCSRWLARLGELCGCNEGLADDPTSDMIDLDGDPRGAVLKIRLPGEAEAVAI